MMIITLPTESTNGVCRINMKPAEFRLSRSGADRFFEWRRPGETVWDKRAVLASIPSDALPDVTVWHCDDGPDSTGPYCVTAAGLDLTFTKVDGKWVAGVTGADSIKPQWRFAYLVQPELGSYDGKMCHLERMTWSELEGALRDERDALARTISFHTGARVPDPEDDRDDDLETPRHAQSVVRGLEIIVDNVGLLLIANPTMTIGEADKLGQAAAATR